MPEVCCNITALSYISIERGIQSQNCSNIASRIQEFCAEKKLRVSAGHIPGKINKSEA